MPGNLFHDFEKEALIEVDVRSAHPLRSANERLFEVDRIVDNGDQRQKVAMPDEVLDHSGFGAAGDTVPLNDTAFHMRGGDGELVAVHHASGETVPRMLGVFGGMRPAVHPDDAIIAAEHAFEG